MKAPLTFGFFLADAERSRPSMASEQSSHAATRTARRGISGPSIVCLAVGALAVGYLLGSKASNESAHRIGACVALEMAAQHGLLDDLHYRLVARSLTGALNPMQHHFRGGYAKFMAQCNSLVNDQD